VLAALRRCCLSHIRKQDMKSLIGIPKSDTVDSR
jgi:hypothetical protein